MMQAKDEKWMWASKWKTWAHRNNSKYKSEYNNIECSTKILHVGRLSIPRIWGECMNCIQRDSILEEELIPFTIRKSRKAIHLWNYKMNEQMVPIIMPNLLQQKPLKKSKAKDHLKALERRLESWISGDLLKLLKEA